MAKRAKRETAYHESGHAVAHYFFPLSGKTTSVTIAEDKLGTYNASKHPVNEALGVHSSGRTIRPIVGRAIDHEQVRDVLITLLAGHAAGWVFAGERHSKAKRDPQAEAEARKHADGGDDFSRALNLLFDADPFDSRAVVKSIPERERVRTSTETLLRRYGQRACDEHSAKVRATFEALWQEAVAFVVERWAHIQAVSDALWNKRTLEGDEVRKIIERIEDRMQRYPKSVQNILKDQHSGDEEATI